jgi:hypothetical protein
LGNTDGPHQNCSQWTLLITQDQGALFDALLQADQALLIQPSCPISIERVSKATLPPRPMQNFSHVAFASTVKREKEKKK